MNNKIDKNNQESRIAKSIWRSAFWLGSIIIAMFIVITIKSFQQNTYDEYDDQQIDNRIQNNCFYLNMDSDKWSYENVCKKFAEQNDQAYDKIYDRYINVYGEKTLYNFLNLDWDSGSSENYKVFDGKKQTYFTNAFNHYFMPANIYRGEYAFNSIFSHAVVTNEGIKISRISNTKESIYDRWKHYSEYYVVAERELKDLTNSNTDFVVYNFTLDLDDINTTLVPSYKKTPPLNITEYGLIISV